MVSSFGHATPIPSPSEHERNVSLGKIIDLRNNDMKPSLKHMSRKHAKEVQELCIRAYEAQIQALAEAEGEGAPLLHTLRKELHQVKKMDPDDAEREAKSFVF